MSTQDIVNCHLGVTNTPLIWNQEILAEGQDHAARAAGMYSSRICNPQLTGAIYPPTLLLGQRPKASGAERPGAAGSLARCQAAPAGTPVPWARPGPVLPGHAAAGTSGLF